VSQFPERSGIFSPSATTFKVTNPAEHNHGLNAEPLFDEGTSLAILGWLFPHVRQERISIFNSVLQIFSVC
jgi:hypothetical protein